MADMSEQSETFSFFANKTITTGEGGFVTFRSDEHTGMAKLIRDHGLSSGSEEHYWHEVQGSNLRMTGLQAAIGLAQLEKIDDITDAKRRLAQRFSDLLPEDSPLTIRGDLRDEVNSHWLIVGEMSQFFSEKRRDLQQHLGMLGIETRLGFQALHRMPAFVAYSGKDHEFPNSTRVSKSILCLPSGANINRSQARSVVRAITDFAEGWRE